MASGCDENSGRQAFRDVRPTLSGLYEAHGPDLSAMTRDQRTRDLDRAKAFAARLESGGVFINGMTASDPRLPFGGVKKSGYGRELAAFGIHEFVNIQTVWIGPAAGAANVTPSE